MNQWFRSTVADPRSADGNVVDSVVAGVPLVRARVIIGPYSPITHGEPMMGRKADRDEHGVEKVEGTKIRDWGQPFFYQARTRRVH